MLFYSLLESHVALFASCLPSLRPLVNTEKLEPLMNTVGRNLFWGYDHSARCLVLRTGLAMQRCLIASKTQY